ncbi:MAG: SH3 domain-containing protein, partial [Beijerinckiaceae bacterium]
LLASAAASTATAQQNLREVRLKPGASATEIRGSIRGYADANYVLRAADGQVMQVLFSASNGACYFNAYEPGAREATHNGTLAGNEFGRSPTRAGRYRFQVYMMRSAARRNETCRFRLSVELTGGRAP